MIVMDVSGIGSLAPGTGVARPVAEAIGVL